MLVYSFHTHHGLNFSWMKLPELQSKGKFAFSIQGNSWKRIGIVMDEGEAWQSGHNVASGNLSPSISTCVTLGKSLLLLTLVFSSLT